MSPCLLVIPALRRPRQENQDFKVIPGWLESSPPSSPHKVIFKDLFLAFYHFYARVFCLHVCFCIACMQHTAKSRRGRRAPLGLETQSCGLLDLNTSSLECSQVLLLLKPPLWPISGHCKTVICFTCTHVYVTYECLLPSEFRRGCWIP